jgi:hypothetical protein
MHQKQLLFAILDFTHPIATCWKDSSWSPLDGVLDQRR